MFRQLLLPLDWSCKLFVVIGDTFSKQSLIISVQPFICLFLMITHPRTNMQIIKQHIKKDKNRWIDEHIKKKYHVFQHLHNKEECFSSFDLNCFSILDLATTKYQTKLKEGMYIDWKKPNLNKQKNHLSTLSI